MQGVWGEKYDKIAPGIVKTRPGGLRKQSKPSGGKARRDERAWFIEEISINLVFVPVAEGGS